MQTRDDNWVTRTLGVALVVVFWALFVYGLAKQDQPRAGGAPGEAQP